MLMNALLIHKIWINHLFISLATFHCDRRPRMLSQGKNALEVFITDRYCKYLQIFKHNSARCVLTL